MLYTLKDFHPTIPTCSRFWRKTFYNRISGFIKTSLGLQVGVKECDRAISTTRNIEYNHKQLSVQCTVHKLLQTIDIA